MCIIEVLRAPSAATMQLNDGTSDSDTIWGWLGWVGLGWGGFAEPSAGVVLAVPGQLEETPLVWFVFLFLFCMRMMMWCYTLHREICSSFNYLLFFLKCHSVAEYAGMRSLRIFQYSAFASYQRRRKLSVGLRHMCSTYC